MRLLIRIFFCVAILILSVLSVSYLQHRFDMSDLKYALAAVKSARTLGPQDATLEEKLTRRYQVAPEAIEWSPTLESKFRGTVLVQAKVPNRSDDFSWKVDLVHFGVYPVSELARELGGK